MADLDYVRVIGRFGLVIGDGDDPDVEPDTVWCDSGAIRITPLSTYTKVAEGVPSPWTAGHSTISATVDADGYLTWNGNPFVWLVDLGSPKVNPVIGPGKATHTINFVDVRADGIPVNFPTFNVRISADTVDPVSGSCDLTLLAPLPAAGGTPVTVGPRGVSVESLAISGGNLTYALSDGTTGDAGAVPTGPGGSDVGVAGYVSDAASATRAALSAAYARKDAAPISVKAHGAVGDGATDDTAAIQAAIDACTVAGGGIVFLPKTANGYAATTLTLKSGVTLRGDRLVTLKKIGAAVGIFILTANGATDCGIENLTINANGLVTSYPFQFSTNTARAFVRRCSFTDTFIAVNGIETRDGTTDLTIEDSFFDGFLDAIRVNQNPQRVAIRRNRFTNWRNRAIYVFGQATVAATDLVIEHNHISAPSFTASGNARQPIQVVGNDAMPHKRVRVNFNTVIGPGTSWTAPSNWGTADQISLHRCEDFEVIGNISRDGGDGGLTVSQQCQRGVVANNVCLNNDAVGIFLGSSTTTFLRRIAVIGNTCVNNGQNRQGDRAAANRAGIWPYNTSDCMISGNVLGDDQGVKTQQYGVSMTACTNLLLGNLDAGNAVALNIKNGAANANINAYSVTAV